MLNRREVLWLDLFATFGIAEVTLKRGKIQVLGDALSRAQHGLTFPKITNLHFLSTPLPKNFVANYEIDIIFGSVYRAIQEKILYQSCKSEGYSSTTII